MDVSRRGFFELIVAIGAGLVDGALPADAAQPPVRAASAQGRSVRRVGAVSRDPINRIRAALRERLGHDAYLIWFQLLDFEGYDRRTLTFSVSVPFLRAWITNHYYEHLLESSRAGFARVRKVEIVLRRPDWVQE